MDEPDLPGINHAQHPKSGDKIHFPQFKINYTATRCIRAKPRMRRHLRLSAGRSAGMPLQGRRIGLL